MGKKPIVVNQMKLRNILSIKERQEILNNGCAGMRSILFYLDSIAEAVDREKSVVKTVNSVNSVSK